MSRIRMNTEFRNKILNRYGDHAETKNTQELEAFKQAREKVDEIYPKAFELARQVVERAYPNDDVQTCRTLKKKYGSPLDVVAKDKCFYFSYAKENLGEDEDESDRNVSEHFDFGLYGDIDNGGYSNKSGQQFAYAYNRDWLKDKGCNPDIYPQMEGKEENPHKTKHIDANNKALGYSSYSSYNSDDDNNVGKTKSFDEQYHLDIIGTSHCRSRTIACNKDEFAFFKMLQQAKAHLVSTHQTWICKLEERKSEMRKGLKAYRYLSEGIDLMDKLGIHIDEAELVRCNSTGLSIYNPENLADRLLSMENTLVSRKDKILARIQYDAEKQSQIN